MKSLAFSVLVLLVLPVAAWAQPTPADVWAGKWQGRVVRSDGSHLDINLELDVTPTGELRGRFSGSVSGTVSGRASGSTAQGRWSLGGGRGGSFALRLSAREAMSGDWNGEGGGRVSGQRVLSARAEDCPSFLMNFVLEDFRDPIGQQCQGPGIPDRVWGFNGDQHERLERFLRRNPDLLGHRPESSAIGASCLERLAREGRLGSVPAERRAEQMAAITAEYYWSKRRLQDALKSSFESLAALDKLRSLGCEPGAGFGRSRSHHALADLHCGEYGSAPGVAKLCDTYKSRCGGVGDHRDLLESTGLAHSQALLLRGELSSGALRPEQRRALQEMVKVTEATSPWLNGAHFKARYDEALARCTSRPGAGAAFCESQKQTFVCEGVRAEAEETRKLVKDQLERFNKAIQCLEGVGTDCDAREFRETLAKAPTFPGAPEPAWVHEGALEGEPAREAADILYANAHFEQAECRQRLRQISNNIRDELQGFAIDASLTVATFGLGAAVGTARLSASAANAVRGASTTAKVSQMGQRASAFARHGPRMLELAALGLDAADLSRSVAEAVRQCGDSFNRLGAVAPPGASAPVCPQGGDYQGARIVSDYRDCVLSAIALEVALGAAPLAPAAVSRLVDRRTLSRAGEALGAAGVLPRSKAEAVLAVFKHRFRRMSDEELDAGILALKKAGFTDDEIRSLFVRLMPDVRDVGGRLVHGLDGTVLAHARVGPHTVSVARARGALKLVTCSDCAELERRFREQLARNPELRGKLDRIKAELDGWSGAGAVPGSVMRQLERVTGELEALKRRDFLHSHGIATSSNTISTPALKGVLTSLEKGHLTERQLNAFAEKADEVIWELEQFFEKNPQLRGQPGFEPMTVPAVRERVGALRAKLAELASLEDAAGLEETKEALIERMHVALQSGQLFFGGNPSSLWHRELPFPRTTPELRAHARAQGSYRDPFGSGSKTFGPSDPIDADHVYPISRILENPTFQSLPEALKREVIHNPDNILPLPAKLNQSKGDRLADAWHEALLRNGGGGLDPAYRNWLRERQEEAWQKLEAQILCLAAGKPPATCR